MWHISIWIHYARCRRVGVVAIVSIIVYFALVSTIRRCFHQMAISAGPGAGLIKLVGLDWKEHFP